MSKIGELIVDMENALIEDMVSKPTLKIWDKIKDKIIRPERLADWMRLKGFTKDSVVANVEDDWTNTLMDGLEEIYSLETRVLESLKGE